MQEDDRVTLHALTADIQDQYNARKKVLTTLNYLLIFFGCVVLAAMVIAACKGDWHFLLIASGAIIAMVLVFATMARMIYRTGQADKSDDMNIELVRDSAKASLDIAQAAAQTIKSLGKNT